MRIGVNDKGMEVAATISRMPMELIALETARVALLGLLGILGAAWLYWIKLLFHLDPDHHNGSAELLIVIRPGLSSLYLGSPSRPSDGPVSAAHGRLAKCTPPWPDRCRGTGLCGCRRRNSTAPRRHRRCFRRRIRSHRWAGAQIRSICTSYPSQFGVRPSVHSLKLFEPKTMCPIIAVRDREGR
jgi:hypothetical protein